LSAEKKGFVLYFDSCRCLEKLPPEQRGYLFSALCAYAEAVCEQDAEPGGFPARFPQLTRETQMAFSFMADAIRRDTGKWRIRKEHYQRGTQARRARAAQTEASGTDGMSEYIRRFARENRPDREDVP